MPDYSTGYSGEYIPDWLRTSVLGAQEEEQGRYQAGLGPYQQQTQYYEPGGEFARQMPSYLYSSFIQPFVGGTGGALRNLFSTTRAGQISMRAAQEAELMRGQRYASAMGALGEATQRYPMMPNLVGLDEQWSYSRPAYSWEGDWQNPNNTSSGGGAGGGAGGGGGGSSGGGGMGSSGGGGGSTGGGAGGRGAGGTSTPSDYLYSETAGFNIADWDAGGNGYAQAQLNEAARLAAILNSGGTVTVAGGVGGWSAVEEHLRRARQYGAAYRGSGLVSSGNMEDAAQLAENWLNESTEYRTY